MWGFIHFIGILIYTHILYTQPFSQIYTHINFCSIIHTYIFFEAIIHTYIINRHFNMWGFIHFIGNCIYNKFFIGILVYTHILYTHPFSQIYTHINFLLIIHTYIFNRHFNMWEFIHFIDNYIFTLIYFDGCIIIQWYQRNLTPCVARVPPLVLIHLQRIYIYMKLSLILSSKKLVIKNGWMNSNDL
jgi:hypothetical protein